MVGTKRPNTILHIVLYNFKMPRVLSMALLFGNHYSNVLGVTKQGLSHNKSSGLLWGDIGWTLSGCFRE